MVWPSVETARDLLCNFFALPEFDRKKNEKNLQPYLEEKAWKVQEKLMRSPKEVMENLNDQLMVQIYRGRKIADLNMNEIYALLSYSKVKVMLFR